MQTALKQEREVLVRRVVLREALSLEAVVAAEAHLDMEQEVLGEAVVVETDKESCTLRLLLARQILEAEAEQDTLQPDKAVDLVLLLYDTPIHLELQRPQDLPP